MATSINWNIQTQINKLEQQFPAAYHALVAKCNDQKYKIFPLPPEEDKALRSSGLIEPDGRITDVVQQAIFKKEKAQLGITILDGGTEVNHFELISTLMAFTDLEKEHSIAFQEFVKKCEDPTHFILTIPIFPGMDVDPMVDPKTYLKAKGLMQQDGTITETVKAIMLNHVVEENGQWRLLKVFSMDGKPFCI